MNKKELFKLLEEKMKGEVVHFNLEFNPANGKYVAELNGERYEFIEPKKTAKGN